MNILNDILLIAGALFVIAMVLICLGLFMNPRKNKLMNLMKFYITKIWNRADT